jgi:hypothetical protein
VRNPIEFQDFLIHTNKRLKGVSKLSEVFHLIYLMDVCLVNSLSKRVAIINVRDLLKHLTNLPCKLQVGSCEAYCNLYLVRSITLSRICHNLMAYLLLLRF